MWQSSRIISLIGRVASWPSSTKIPTTCSNNNIMIQQTLTSTFFNKNETRRYMSKYLSKSAAKRLPLNPKRVGKGYYKGKGGTSEGRLTSKGKFIANPMKKLQLMVPNLTGFPLKPYIAMSVPKRPPELRRGGPNPAIVNNN